MREANLVEPNDKPLRGTQSRISHVRGGVVQMIPHGARGTPCSLQPLHGLAPLLVERHVAQARAEVVGALHRALEQLLVEAL